MRRPVDIPFPKSIATCLSLSVTLAGGVPSQPLSPDSTRVADSRLAAQLDLTLGPVEAVGDIHFSADAAVLFDADGAYALEVFVGVPHTPLDWVRSGHSYRAELEIAVTASELDRRQARTLTVNRSLEATSFEETRRIEARSIEIVTGTLSFRPVEIEVEVRDLRSRKDTLIGRIRGDKRSGTARFMLPVSRARSRTDELSTLVFGVRTRRVEDRDGTDRESIVHGGVALYPNPTRFVGLDLDVFPVYFEIYQRGTDGGYSADPAPRTLGYRISTRSGEELLAAEDAVDPRSGRWGRVQRFDVSGFGTGTYVLSVELLATSGEVLDVAYGEFHVLWQNAAWMRDEATVLNDAQVLLRPEEFDRFEAMAPGERAAHMARLWEALDSDPGTEVNETRQEFARRLGRAEQLYGGLEGGKLSDRGRVLIRYGEPQEIIPVRIPTRHDTFADVVSEEIRGSLGNTIDASDPRLISFFRRNFRENPAFEIWKYYGGGDPIIEEQRGPARGMGFIFVDETGVGFYQLGYTNVTGLN